MWLDGKKTYIAGLIAVVLSVLSSIFGWFEVGVNLEILFMGLIALGLRRAIDEQKVK